MNEYIVSNSTGWIGINNGTNLVLMSVTDNLESGGRISNTHKNYLIGLGEAPKYELIKSNDSAGEAIVTIGGNFLSDELEEKGNLVYHAENVQGAVAAINFSGDGKVYITAQSGAIGPDAKDSDVMVVVTNQFISPDSASGSGEKVDEESRVTAAQNVSASAFKAFKTLTIGGSFSGQYFVNSVGSDFSSYSVAGEESSRVIMSSGQLLDINVLKGADILIQNKSDAVMTVNADAVIVHVSDDRDAGVVTENRVVASALWSVGLDVDDSDLNGYEPEDGELDIQSERLR